MPYSEIEKINPFFELVKKLFFSQLFNTLKIFTLQIKKGLGYL